MQTVAQQIEEIKHQLRKEWYVPKLRFLENWCNKVEKIVCSEQFDGSRNKFLQELQIIRAQIVKRIAKSIEGKEKREKKEREKFKYPRNKSIKGQEYKDPLTTLHNSPTTTSKSVFTYRGGHPRY